MENQFSDEDPINMKPAVRCLGPVHDAAVLLSAADRICRVFTASARFLPELVLIGGGTISVSASDEGQLGLLAYT